VDAEIKPRARVVFIEGVFDRAAAAIVGSKLIDSSCDVVVLDFGRAREISNVALADLVATVAHLDRPRVTLRGLGQHHERMLRYLRVGAAARGVA
jgi:hypothetical protein